MTRTRVRGATRRDETILRLGGDVYVTAMTWTSDDRQLVTFIDGTGWPEEPRDHYYSSRTFTASGTPGNAEFRDLVGYPDIPLPDIYKGQIPLYYGFSVLAVENTIYQYLTTTTMDPFDAEVRLVPGFGFDAVKLIYSPDNGRTWHNQDGSTPVVRESHQEQPRTMLFFQEPQNAFAMVSLLQMGQAYRANTDGYVYGYAPNGSTEGTMNQLIMFRVPVRRVLERGSYTYFAGHMNDGGANWTSDVAAREVVHTFPAGWVPSAVSFAWFPSVAYNEPLGIYLMASASSQDPTGINPKDAASYLGIWSAETPWGPWKQIHEEYAWTPGGNPRVRAGTPVIAPGWFSDNGKSFWLVWNESQQANTDAAAPDEKALIAAMRSTSDEAARLGRRRWRAHHPGWSFNTQRVDLLVE